MPVKYSSFSDRHVAWWLVGGFVAVDRIVFLTENSKNDTDGLRRVLLNEVKPAVDAYHGDRLGLLVLMKKGKTTWSHYAEAMMNRLVEGVDVGFEYVDV